jgi:hypothetical protein
MAVQGLEDGDGGGGLGLKTTAAAGCERPRSRMTGAAASLVT